MTTREKKILKQLAASMGRTLTVIALLLAGAMVTVIHIEGCGLEMTFAGLVMMATGLTCWGWWHDSDPLLRKIDRMGSDW